MKKIFIAIVAIAAAALASCAKEELVSLDKGATIAFSNAFVDNATKAAQDPSNTTNNLTAFKVYGAVETTTENVYVNIFSDVDVTKTQTNSTDIGSTGTWWYDAQHVQYWIEGKDYKFAAVVGGDVSDTDAAGMPTEITVDATAQQDVLYDSKTTTGTANAQNVAFTFSHLLSKVKFVANVATMAEAYSYKVKNITINNVADGGVYTIGATKPWAANTTYYSPSFGNIVATSTEVGADATKLTSGMTGIESNYERLLVPGTVASISFTVELYYNDGNGDQCINIDSDPISVDIPLAEGTAYNFVINLPVPGNPITFSAQAVNTWAGPTGFDVPLQ